MNLGGIGNKILTPIAKNSSVIGGGLATLERVENIKLIISKAASGSIHMPNFGNWLNQVANAPQYQSAGIAALIAYIGKDALGSGFIKRVAEAIQKAGVAYVATGALIDLAWWSTNSAEGCTEPGAKMPASMNYNRGNASTQQSRGYGY